MWSCLVCGLLLSLYGCQSVPLDDLIVNLPGIIVQPSFREFAGYLEPDEFNRFFYWFVEAEHNPETAPVVLWLNGGPGCSSMTGFLAENGPFRSHVDGTLTYFEYSWSRNANMIFMDAPGCVGFSYNIDTFGDCHSSDDETAHLNHMAMRDFFSKFPEYANHDFYITGESYAGVYVPMLSALCIDDPSLNFQGFMVGNGVSDRTLMESGLVYFEYGHGMFMDDTWFNLVDNCCPNEDSTHCYFDDMRSDPNCRVYMNKVDDLQWDSVNPYAMNDPCFGGFSNFSDPQLVSSNGKQYLPFPYGIHLSDTVAAQYHDAVQRYKDDGIGFYGSIPCTDTSDRANYLNRADVREALHVPPFVPDWEACSNTLSYIQQHPNMTDYYNTVIQHPTNPKRGWMYYGDTDLACNIFSGSWFAEDDLTQTALSQYRRWFFEDVDNDNTMQTGGWVKDYVLLKHISVLGSGHMVPTDTPQQAYVIFQTFINNLEFDTILP